VLREPNVEADRCRVAILDERLAEGMTDTDRLSAAMDGFGSGVDAEKQVDCDRGGRT
jgi:hypothetical protein